MVEGSYCFIKGCQVSLTNKMTFKLRPRPIKNEGVSHATIWEIALQAQGTKSTKALK